jgi:cell shape-determining protein MreD
VITALAWLAGILQVLFKGSFIAGMGSYFLDIDLVTVMIAYLLIHSGRTGACVYAFFLGMLVDLFAAGVPGLFTLIYMAVFLTIEAGSRFFDLQTIKGPMILVFLGALVRQVFLVGLLDIFSYQVHFTASLFLGFAVSAAVMGLIAPFVFSFFDWIKAVWLGLERESA